MVINLDEGDSLGALEGRDEWLFLETVGGSDALGYYTDEGKIADETIAEWAAALQRRRSYFDGLGIAYQTLIAPDAHLVYRDKLPEQVILAQRSPFDRLSQALDAQTREQCVYPLAELVAGREQDETYQPVDVHWSEWGAWVAYRASIEALSRTVPSIALLDAKRVAWSVQSTVGSLGGAVTPERQAEVPVANVKRAKAKQSARLVTERGQSLLVVEQNAPDLPSAVVFRDSFMTEPARFFAESFRRVVFVTAASSIYFDLIERERPDVVIHEMGERRLAISPVEPSFSDFRQLFGDLLLDDAQAETDQRRSRTLMRQGNWDEALAANEAVMHLVPPTARLLFYRAQLHALRGQDDAAIEALRHATTLDPDDAAPWQLLGHMHERMDRLAEAAASFARAARAEPRQADYWQLGMSAALKAGDLSLAEELRETAVLEHPDNATISNAASWVLVATDRFAEAEEAAAFAVKVDPRSDAHLVQLANLQIRRKRWESAAATLDQLRLLGSEHPAMEQYQEVVDSHVGALPKQKTEGSA